MRRLTRNLTYNTSNKRWCKKIDGKIVYFGSSACSQAEALAELDALISQRTLATTLQPAAIDVGTLAEAYAVDCEQRIKLGQLKPLTWEEYRRPIQALADVVGVRQRVADLRPQQFRTLRHSWEGSVGPHAMARYVRAVRTMFNWGKLNNLIHADPLYGREFEPPASKELRMAVDDSAEANGERMFTDDELALILTHPSCVGLLRACVLLGLNGGMYAADCASLAWRHVQEYQGVRCIVARRTKSDAKRITPLWPETIAAIESFRMPGQSPDDLVFRSPAGDMIALPDRRVSYLGKLFDRLRSAAKIRRRGVGFGSLKHTHITAVSGVDERAAAIVSAHEVGSVRAHYDKVPIDRLVRIATLAREKLFLQILTSRRSTPGDGT